MAAKEEAFWRAYAFGRMELIVQPALTGLSVESELDFS